MMLLVTGANGNFAGAVIENLKAIGVPFAVTTRDPGSARAQALASEGVAVRRADFDQPETLGDAMAGITTALIVSTMSPNDIRLQQNLAALAAAKAAGVQHVIYTSFLNAGPDALPEHSQLVHSPTEQAIMASGLTYTFLRHALYAEVWVGDLDATLASGVLRRPGGDARCAFVPRDELGISAAKVMTSPGHENKIYSETMPEALTGAEIAALIADVFGSPVRYEAVAAADWPQFMAENWGVPIQAARSALGTMRAVETGEFNIVSDDYAKIVGHPTRTWRAYLEDLKAARG